MFGFVSVAKPDALPLSLLSDVRPPEGFDENWRHELKDVGEFRLVEMWRPGGPRVVEYSNEVQAAFDQAYFSISDAHGVTKPAER